MSSKSVIVIGGGLAGLAAGVALAEAGYRIRLFEKRPFLGGRATSYVLPNGEHVDNCQHVTFGCCTNLEDFYKRVSAAGKIKFFDRLLLIDPEGRRGELKAGLLPAPFHLLGSFLAFSPLALSDKFSIARAMLHIVLSKRKSSGLEDGPCPSMLQWLRQRRQPQRAIDRFWRVVLVSALSEELDKTDARYGVDVFWKAVLSNRAGYRMGVPTIPLAALYDGCRAAIENRGGEVNLRAAVRGLHVENGVVQAVRFEDERQETADAYICALPHNAVSELLPENLRQREPFRNLDKLKVSPITGVHLWFDREVMTEPFVTLLETTTQWIFNKTALYGSSSVGDNSGGQYLQLVISASYDLLQRPREEIIELCLKELKQTLPAVREARLVKATVIKEAAAIFSPQPGVDRWRPKQKTEIRGLYLAGDWTDTGWPATMEGAVRSGYLAAEALLAQEGKPQKFVRPDLPVEMFGSSLFG